MSTAENAPSRQQPSDAPAGQRTTRVKRKLNSAEVIDALTDLFILRGVPAYIRSDYGSEFIAQAVRHWIGVVGVKTAYFEPGYPLSGRRHAMRCRAVHGRTDTVKALMPCFAPLGSMLCMRLLGNG